MIDYEKFKLAHSIASNSELYYFKAAFGIYADNIKLSLIEAKGYAGENIIFETFYIDNLIAKLQDLTQSEPMYKTAWYIYEDDIQSTEFRNGVGYAFCDRTDIRALGRHMYNSREELIQAQIEYWQSLSEDKPECHHEWDGKFYDLLRNECNVGETMHFQAKCNKCGEFYR